jgi:hypothetical protein
LKVELSISAATWINLKLIKFCQFALKMSAL